MTIAVAQRRVKAFFGLPSFFPLSVTATTPGNLLVVTLVTGQSNPITAVADNGGNTWARSFFDNGALGLHVWTTTDASPGSVTSITTANNFNGEFVAYAFYEISGALSNTSPLDVTHDAQAGPSATSAANSGSSGTPSNTGDLAIGFAVWLRTNTTTTADTGPTLTTAAGTNQYANSVPNGSTSFSISASDLVLTAATAQTFSSTLVAQNYWAAGVTLIKGVGPLPPVGKASVISQSMQRAANW